MCYVLLCHRCSVITSLDVFSSLSLGVIDLRNVTETGFGSRAVFAIDCTNTKPVLYETANGFHARS